MSKIRVYELGKQLEKDNAEIIAKLKELGVDIKNHMSSVTMEDAQKVKDAFNAVNKPQVQENKPKAEDNIW